MNTTPYQPLPAHPLLLLGVCRVAELRAKSDRVPRAAITDRQMAHILPFDSRRIARWRRQLVKNQMLSAERTRHGYRYKVTKAPSHLDKVIIPLLYGGRSLHDLVAMP